MEMLSRIEEILLIAIWKLKDNAYGISIREQVRSDTGVKWQSGAVYAPLNRLKKNGYVRTYKAEGSAGKGGRPRIYYQLTRLGKKKLATIQDVNESIWMGVPDLKKEFES
ncbi:MAG: hypothetical protein GF421_12575 [Candidatus Aminicenantes bacterium]|nr:hypothetical protein [Candidatus Aminicenantes bacterium]